MELQERHWLAALGAGTLVVAALTLGPALWPRPQVPTVTRSALPLVTVADPTAASSGAPTAEPPTYPATASVTPLISGRLNLNVATEEQIEALPKVGPALAGRILAARPFRSLADLDAVKGIGPSTLKMLAPLVTF